MECHDDAPDATPPSLACILLEPIDTAPYRHYRRPHPLYFYYQFMHKTIWAEGPGEGIVITDGILVRPSLW